ncbi:MAG: ATP-binding cassette domain-containing protein, partial [Desulfurococcaceae archaeon]
NEGEIVFLVGKNGAGKTTLLKTIAGFIRPKTGKIVFQGKDITYTSPLERSRMGISMAFQEKRIFPSLTVRDNIHVVSRACGLNEDEALSKALTLFPELEILLDRRADTLSGGQRQMLALSMAMLCNPKLLLLDEPVEGLSGKVASRIMDVIRKNRGTRISVLIAEQNVPLVVDLADRVYIIKEGKIVKILEHPTITYEDVIKHV